MVTDPTRLMPTRLLVKLSIALFGQQLLTRVLALVFKYFLNSNFEFRETALFYPEEYCVMRFRTNIYNCERAPHLKFYMRTGGCVF